MKEVRPDTGVPQEVEHRLRRVGHSYAVTLPSRWVAEGGWKQDDVLHLRKFGSNSIIVGGPAASPGAAEAIVTIRGDGAHLFRELVGAYLQGQETISIRGDRPLRGIPSPVREFLRRTATMVIVEEEASRLILQDVSGVDVPLPSRLARMHSLVVELHENAASRWKEDPLSAPEELSRKDDEVDRVGWQVRRALVRRTREPVGTPVEEAIPILLLSRIWERIGDLAVRIAAEQLTLSGSPPPRSLLTHLGDLHSRTIEMLKKAPQVLVSSDFAEANGFIDNVSAWEGERTALLHEAVRLAKAQRLSSEALASVSITLEEMVRMARYLADLGELVLDSPPASFTRLWKEKMTAHKRGEAP